MPVYKKHTLENKVNLGIKNFLKIWVVYGLILYDITKLNKITMEVNVSTIFENPSLFKFMYLEN